MRKVLLYSIFLFLGLAGSQFLPNLATSSYGIIANCVRVFTMVGLSFIMIHVGFEFNIDKSRLASYGWDYFVAFTAAFFPWLFVSLYFVFAMLPPEYWFSFDAWKEVLLAGRFAAPTSAGVLFSMLLAAGLGSTWVFKKARILAIFDDLDTVLLMIPLKMLMVGIAWQLGLVVAVMVLLLIISYVFMHQIKIHVSFGYVLMYSAIIVGICELTHALSTIMDPSVPIHLEVLLPAFALGTIAKPIGLKKNESIEDYFHKLLHKPKEMSASSTVSVIFMLLVGLSMPPLISLQKNVAEEINPSSLYFSAPASAVDKQSIHSQSLKENKSKTITITKKQKKQPWKAIALHVFFIFVLSNIGKMFAALCYRKEAHWRQRLAVAIGMWPRGEVGAGVLVLSLSYGIGGPIVNVAMISLALNLLLTGIFIWIVRKLIQGTNDMPLRIA